jgi:hypothetical protein
MDIPGKDLLVPPKVVAALAAAVRQRLSEAAETLVPFLVRRDIEVFRPGGAPHVSAEAAFSAAHQVATLIVGAAAPFAPTPQARLRLLRQMHASGLLSQREADSAIELLEIAN